MNAQVYMNVGEKSLRNSTLNMKLKVEEERLLKLNGYGIKLLILKLRQEHHICCIKIHAIENRINKI